MAAQQAGNTSPNRGGGSSFFKSSCVQLAAPCLGCGISPFDHSRSSPWDSALVIGRTGNCAAIAQVCSAPFLVAERGGCHQSSVVEQRRNRIHDVTVQSSSREVRI